LTAATAFLYWFGYADIALGHLLSKSGAENARVSQLATLRQLRGFKVSFLEMQAVGNHQFDAICRCGPDDGFAFFFGDCHGLLAQNVNSGLRRSHCVIVMKMIGNDQVDGVGLLLAQFLSLFGISGNDKVFLMPWEAGRLDGSSASQQRGDPG
jgi:hypothetical protein